MSTRKIAATLAAGTLALALAACDSESFREGYRDGRGQTATTVTATETTRVSVAPQTVTAPAVPAAPAEDPMERAFMDTTCDLLDQGFGLDAIVLGGVTSDSPFTAEEVGELIATAIIMDCPEYIAQMEQFLYEGES